MKILMVTDFYHPYVGGVEMHVRTIAHALAERGHTIGVASLADAEAPDDGPVRVFPVRHFAQRASAAFAHEDRQWAPPIADPIATRALRRIVNEFAPDVIHGHDWLARSVEPAAASGATPIVTSLHYYTRSCPKKTLWRDGVACSGPALAKCLRCAGQHYGAAKGTVVTLANHIGRRVSDRRTTRWISVSQATADGNGLDADCAGAVIANPLPTGAGAATAPLPPGTPDGPFLLFVGDLRPEKGLPVLADALRRHDIGMPLVTAGERMDASIQLPAGTVELGQVPNEQVHRLWAQAAMGVVPSVWPEPFGIVAIEALAAGCPLVASNIGGLREIVQSGGGVLVPPGDAEALGRALADLGADDARRATMSEAATRASERYLLEPIIDQIEAEYTLAIASAQ